MRKQTPPRDSHNDMMGMDEGKKNLKKKTLETKNSE
jgi:hypothetical protein